MGRVAQEASRTDLRNMRALRRLFYDGDNDEMNGSFTQAAPPYPVNAFHDEIQWPIREVMDKIKSPDGLVGTSFIATMSTACQGLIDVKLPIGQICPVSTNVLIKAESGERKTATDKIVAAPIYAHDEASITQHESDMVQYASDLSFWKTYESALKSMIVKGIKDGADIDDLRLRLDEHTKSKPIQPQSRRMIHQAATDPAFMKSLEGEGRSVTVGSDEGETVTQGGLLNRPGLRNKGWDGAQLLVFDRITTGSTIARQPRVTMNIMVQSAVLDAYQQSKGAVARGSGFWARYLVGAPASTQGFRFINHIDEEWRHLPRFHSRVRELLQEYDAMMVSGNATRRVIEFDPAATADWVRMVNAVEGMIQPWQYLNDIHDFASKVVEITSRLAAILHFFTKQEGKISADTFGRAKCIVEWHLHEYKRLFSPQVPSPTMLENIVAVEKHLYFNYWKVGLLRAGRNQVLRGVVDHLRQKAMLYPVLEAMVAQGRIALMKDGSSNKVLIALNPDYFSKVIYV